MYPQPGTYDYSRSSIYDHHEHHQDPHHQDDMKNAVGPDSPVIFHSHDEDFHKSKLLLLKTLCELKLELETNLFLIDR
jgi:hypothetical protein